MKKITICSLLFVFSITTIFSQFQYNIETGASLGQALSKLSIGYNISFTNGNKISDFANIKFGYGITDNIDIKINYQRAFVFDANVVTVIPKYSFGNFSVTSGIGSIFISGDSETFLNAMMAYDYEIDDDFSSTFGIGYNSFFSDFGDGNFGAYVSSQRNFDSFGIKVFYHGTFQDPFINMWGAELMYNFENSSDGKSNKGGRSINDYF